MTGILFLILLKVCTPTIGEGIVYDSIEDLPNFQYALPLYYSESCVGNYIPMKTRVEVNEYLRKNEVKKGFLVDLKQGKIFKIEQEAFHRMLPREPVEILDHYEVELTEEGR